MGKHLKEKKKNRVNNVITLLVNIVLIGVIIISSIKIYNWYKENKSSNEILEEISNAITINTDSGEEEEDKYNIDFNLLKEKNEETVAWIKVNNTNIEYPVVKTNDNSYYLTHSFDKSYNSAGWIFANYKNSFDGTDKNIVLFGHNRKDESMFGTLKNVLKEDWYNNEENKDIVFITEESKSIYRVFSVYKVLDEDYYIRTKFKNDEYAKFIETIKSRSINDFGETVTEDDNILTLSTCANNDKYRIVLHAKKIK